MSYGLLFRKSYELVKWVYPAVNKFPKSQRLILSQRIENTSICILEMVISLSYKDSRIVRRKILTEVHKLQILMRLSKDLSFLDFKKYEYVSGMLKEISELLERVGGGLVVRTYRNLYDRLCSFENLHLAYKKARKNKKYSRSMAEFEMNLESELLRLKHELETETYQPRPLKQFAIRDPKTRRISASHFRDRVVHHALCNVIEPIFDETFIPDSYANRKGKGTLAAILKFDEYKRKASGNGRLLPYAKGANMVYGYVVKADIKHYFDSVDHEVMMRILARRVKDRKVLKLVKKILENHPSRGKGMPIGNLTSQFFANVYLNELDYFVKHELKARFYIRYVDDFVILDGSKKRLEKYKTKISEFLETIKLELHPEKSRVIPLQKGVKFLGFRVFYRYKLVKKSNVRKIEKRLENLIELYKDGTVGKPDIFASLQGWNAYAMHGDTYKIRKKMEKETRNTLRRIARQKPKAL